MSFLEWRDAYVAHCSSLSDRVEKDAGLARLANLEAESRVDGLKRNFQTLLGTQWVKNTQGGMSTSAAAVKALSDVMFAAWQSPGFKFALTAAKNSADMSTYATALDLAQSGALGDIEADDVPAAVNLPDGVLFDTKFKPMIWLCPDICPDDPDQVASGLGLPHFQNHVVFRFSIPTADFDLSIPSCFDARLYEAWEFPPDVNSGFGMTRDVETAERPFRELVVPKPQTDGSFTRGVRVPSAAPAIQVKIMTPNYMKGRSV